MQLFRCPACGEELYFHNTACTCGQLVTFDVERQQMRTDAWFCANRDDIACNWSAPEQGTLCASCQLTDVVPDLRAEGNVGHWADTEFAKRWVLANLARWGWFTAADGGTRPRFRMLSEETLAGEENVVMGHADGVITINVTEASQAVRAERQEELEERYRTMSGHIRHEMAHFLFIRLAEDPAFLGDFRGRFGDEQADYAAALQAHYDSPRENDGTFITRYATAHPHEDWAETVAHLLHLVDLTDSVAAAGLSTEKGPPPGYDAYAEADSDAIVRLAVDVALAINHVNRSMNLPDVYPFVLTPGVRDKLDFAHERLRHGPGAAAPGS
jgi:hypothetical protein